MAAAAIEVVIRARDEASATVSATMQKIAAEATRAGEAIGKATTGGGNRGAQNEANKMMAEMQRGLKGTADASTAMVDALGAVATAIPGPWGMAMKTGVGFLAMFAAAEDHAIDKSMQLASALRGFDPGPFLAKLEEADADLERLAKRADRGWLGQKVGQVVDYWTDVYKGGTPEERIDKYRKPAMDRLQLQNEAAERAARGQIEDVAMARALDAGREARRVQDLDAMTRATDEYNAAAERRLNISREQLNADRQAAIAEAQRRNLPFAGTAQEAAFNRRGELLEQQATLARAQRADEAAAQQRAIDEETASRRLKIQLRVYDAEREASDAAIDARTKAEIRFAEDFARLMGQEEDAYQAVADAQIAGAERSRDAQIKAIHDVAAARIAAVRGPNRAEEIETLRAEEAARVRAATTKAQAQIDDLEAQRRRQDDERARRSGGVQSLIDEERKKDPTFLASLYAPPEPLPPEYADELKRTKEMRLLEASIAEQRDSIELSQARSRMLGDMAATGTVGMSRWQAAAEAAAPQRYVGPEIEWASGTEKLKTGMDQAADATDKLTGKVKDLGGALKDLQVSPSFAAKLSQDLADTLEFLGARNP